MLLDKAIFYLLSDRNERFFGEFFFRMRTIYKTMPYAAGVSITDRVNLYIDPEKFGQFPIHIQAAILKHEIMHIISCHPIRAKEFNKMKYNIAADAAINQYIPELHGIGVLPEKIGAEKAWETAEYYYACLPEQPDSEGYTTLDDHSEWNNGETNGEMMKEVTGKAIQEAKDATKKSAGDIPMEVQSAIEKNFNSTVPWEKMLRMFIHSASSAIKESSRKKRNRRYGLIYPGKKKKPSLRLGFLIDTSGSVSDESLSRAFAELDTLGHLVAEIIIIEADTMVHNVYKYEKGKTKNVTGRGGTAYQPAIDRAMEMKLNGIIYFGDMDSSDVPNDPKIPFLWLINNDYSTPPANFGKIARMKENA